MGIFPVWGFQLLIAIGLSFALRLNKGLVILAANISIPPVIPFILWLSHFVGGYWLGDSAQSISFSKEITLEMMWDNFFQYVIGAVTLSILAGVIFGVFTFLMLKIFRKSGGESNSDVQTGQI